MNASSNMKPMNGGMLTVGSKAQVFHGTAKHTKGGLTRKDLVKNKRGKIVSRKQAEAGKKAYSRLVAAGYKPKKGTFKLFTKKSKRASHTGGFW
jgi:DVNP family